MISSQMKVSLGSSVLSKIYIFLYIFVLVSACSSKKNKQGEQLSTVGNNTQLENTNFTLEVNGDSDNLTAGSLKTIYFAVDSISLDKEAMRTLESNIKFLFANKFILILIEGHCDERGGVQYNLALGQKRARMIRDYLVVSGISADRISMISLGKENPIDISHSEISWAKNRRANFVIKFK